MSLRVSLTPRIWFITIYQLPRKLCPNSIILFGGNFQINFRINYHTRNIIIFRFRMYPGNSSYTPIINLSSLSLRISCEKLTSSAQWRRLYIPQLHTANFFNSLIRFIVFYFQWESPSLSFPLQPTGGDYPYTACPHC